MSGVTAPDSDTASGTLAGSGATIADVARLAGVSIKSVSRVGNGAPNVREQTRARVQAAIDKLGYRPNLHARYLVSLRR